MDGKIYQFEGYLLDVAEQRLQKDGQDIQMPPKVFEVLTALLNRHGQLITYQELMDEVWPETFVEETNLRYSVHTLRKTLPESFIETVPKRGYRFRAEVKSFNKEEFIKIHTGSFKKDALPIPSDETTVQKNVPTVFRKFLPVAAVALVMTGIGLAAFYLWPKNDVLNGKTTITVTVLPFKIVGEESEPNRNLQKNLLESIVFDLNKIKNLRAGVSENETARYSTDLILEGSYRFETERSVQVTLRLWQTSDGLDLLNETISVKDESKFKTEKTLSLKIGRKVFDKMAAGRDEEFVKTQKIGEESRKNYLNGQQILRNPELFRREEGIEAFEKVIASEPDWAKGHAKLAEAIVLLHGGMPDWEKARQTAEKALAIDPNLPEAYIALGWFHQSKFDWENAEKSFARAIELDPEYSEAYLEYGLLLDTKRKFAEAEKKLLHAVTLKPFEPFYFASLCQHYYYDGKFDLAVKNCQEAANIDPNFNLVYKHLFWIYVEQADYKAAFKNDFGELTEDEVEKSSLARALRDGNMTFYWQQRIKNRLQDKERRYSPLTIATFYAQLRDKENTLKYLEEMAETSPIDILYANPIPSFDFVRKEPRFINLLKKGNL